MAYLSLDPLQQLAQGSAYSRCSKLGYIGMFPRPQELAVNNTHTWRNIITYKNCLHAPYPAIPYPEIYPSEIIMQGQKNVDASIVDNGKN